MVDNYIVHAILIRHCLWLLLVLTLTHEIVESDTNCLSTIDSELKDLSLEEISYGVTWWDNRLDHNQVLSINFSGLGLKGNFPNCINQCTSLTSLNLSSNNLTGTVPSNIFILLPYLVTLDLSNNSFYGEIPSTWSNILYLNILLLDHNHFIGHIPQGLASNPRLKQFSVAHNYLEGPVLVFANGNTSLASFENNLDLCGFPLEPCLDSLFSMGVVAAVIAAGVSFPIGVAIGWFCVRVGEGHKVRPRRRRS